MWDDVREEAEFELSQLRTLFQQHGFILRKASEREPSTESQVAMGAVLHSFYNGVENVFKRIAQEIDREVPAGSSWHHDLLSRMGRPSSSRPLVISPELLEKLSDYLNFRHVFRHVYTFQVEWPRMAGLVSDCERTFERFAEEATAFFATGESQ